jgi:tetratricopeptide (TPR) repeat protein
MVESGKEQAYWWSSYGPFPPAGAGATRPHAGRVIAHYRKMRKWSASRLAQELGLKRSQMYHLERQPDPPEPLSRRELLARVLAIPPMLLGMPEIVQRVPVAILPATTIEAHESVLRLAWSAYYSSSAEEAATTVALFISHLENEIQASQGIAADQLRATLCRFYQLSGVAARDRLDWQTAHAHGTRAIDLARHLCNADLIVTALLRRARTYVEMRRYDLAVTDLEQARASVERARDPARSYALLCLAEAYSLAFPHDEERQRESLRLLDGVARVVRSQGILEGDGSHTKVDAPGMLMMRGDILRRFGALDEANEALLIAREQLPRHFVRWQGNLLVSEAQLCYAERDFEGACDLAADALSILGETRSAMARAKIERLHARMARIAPGVRAVQELGTRLEQR